MDGKREYWLTKPLTARQVAYLLKVKGLLPKDYDEDDIIDELINAGEGEDEPDEDE